MGIKILAFSAHTGDVEITAGGSILRNAEEGGRCLILHMFKPSGKWARPPGLSAEEYAETRVKQALEASRKLNAEAVFLGCVEGVPYDAEEVKQKMYKALSEFMPDAVLIHWKGSYHPDHLACHLLAVQAFRMEQDDVLLRHGLALGLSFACNTDAGCRATILRDGSSGGYKPF